MKEEKLFPFELQVDLSQRLDESTEVWKPNTGNYIPYKTFYQCCGSGSGIRDKHPGSATRHLIFNICGPEKAWIEIRYRVPVLVDPLQ